MSRIAGGYHEGVVSNDSNLTSEMLKVIKTVSDWSVYTDSLGCGEIGWIGNSDSKLLKTGSIIAAIDGHIYNHDELGGEGSDIDLVVDLYQKYGFEKMIQSLNGDFAISLYDTSDDTIWLARDRFGIKPLFYVENPLLFAFSSRLKALLTLPEVSLEPRREFVARFAGSHYRYFDNDMERSPYQDISQLPAAHILCHKNRKTRIFRYWQINDLSDLSGTKEDLARHYRDLLLDSVTRRLRVSKMPAFTLSGGMDSSSVMAAAVKIAGKKQHAFSTVYKDKTYDESEEIFSMLDSCVDRWHKVYIDVPDVVNLIQKMISLHDEPVATATWLSHYLLCEETKKQGFESLFGGLGGDELNAGEYEHFLFFFADLRAAGNEERLRHEVKMWSRYHDHPLYRKNADIVDKSLNKIVDLNKRGKCLPDRDRINSYSRAINTDYFDLCVYEPVMDHPFSSYLKNRTYQDMTRETIPCCLRAEDRQTTAFGLDNFLPFLDYRLVEFMFRVPGTLKYEGGVTKYLLREAMKDILPEDTRLRVKKTGWNAPAHMWFSGKGQEPLRDLIGSSSFRNRGIYHHKEVERLLEEHEEIVSTGAMRENHMMFFWQLINLELWFQSMNNGSGIQEDKS